jgi:hypothetical protein
VNACTIVARNYLAHARVLAASVARHHAGERPSVLVIDGEVGGERASSGPNAEPFETILPTQLPLPHDEYRRMASMYDVTELATAVKPFFLRFLLDRGSAAAVYLDPDIEVYAPLDDLVRLAGEHEIVLIPHTLRPVPADGRKPTSADLSASGVYNLGFIAVGAGARPFLDWWGERLRRDCVMAPEEGLFVDQRLLDFLPAFHAPHIVRDPAYNVAYWNLHERQVTWTGQHYEVGGAPLRFFHFSGFDPLAPDVLSRHQGRTPRTVLAEQPDLARLCREYAHRLLAAGYRDSATVPYGFAATANGTPFDRRMRRVYRAALLAAERGAGSSPPAPLDPAEARTFTAWIADPATLDALPPRMRAALLLEEGPALGSRSSVVRLVQRALLRLLRPLLLHQRRLAEALLQSLDELAAERTGRGPQAR